MTAENLYQIAANGMTLPADAIALIDQALREARREGLEEAAKLVDTIDDAFWSNSTLAPKIRSLKDKQS